MPFSKKFQINFLVIIAITVITYGFIVFFYSQSKNDTKKTPTNLPLSELKHLRSAEVGLELDYPSFFAPLESKQQVLLSSEYFYDQNSSGKPNLRPNRKIYSISFNKKNSPIETVIKQENPSFYNTYKELARPLNNAAVATAQIRQISGKPAYGFNTGAEGVNMRFVYIPLNAKETWVITLTYFGDSIKNQVMSGDQKTFPFSEGDQLQTFNTVLSSVKFIQ
jgi:hypothetical protein